MVARRLPGVFPPAGPGFTERRLWWRYRATEPYPQPEARCLIEEGCGAVYGEEAQERDGVPA